MQAWENALGMTPLATRFVGMVHLLHFTYTYFPGTSYQHRHEYSLRRHKKMSSAYHPWLQGSCGRTEAPAPGAFCPLHDLYMFSNVFQEHNTMSAWILAVQAWDNILGYKVHVMGLGCLLWAQFACKRRECRSANISSVFVTTSFLTKITVKVYFRMLDGLSSRWADSRLKCA